MKNIRDVQLIPLTRAQDHRGSLCVAEHGKHVPFEINRCFWVFEVPNSKVRGEHAHKLCHQLLVCVSGSCAVIADDGQQQQEFVLNNKHAGLYIPPMLWTTQHQFSKEATLLVMASHLYEADDYIRDYQEFLACRQLTKKG